MPATMPGLADQTTTTMPAPAMNQNVAPSANTGPTAGAANSNAALSLNNTAVPQTDNSANSSGSAGNANSNASLNFPPVSTGSSGTTSTALRTRHHYGRTLTLSAPHSGIYIVRKGDTLAAISTRIYGSLRMIHALERANPGLDPRRMRIGQKIRLPRHGSATLATRYHRSHLRHHAYASSSHGGQMYVVRSGEDLYDIARKFYHNGGMWKKIYNANRRTIGPRPNDLRAGERIVIPAR
jgi:nucleoid-associated protein YgaU